MSNCGYFKIHKGKVSCTHPTYGEEYNSWSKNLNNMCQRCKRECGGIYPSQLPSADQTGWEYDVVVTERKPINGMFNNEYCTVILLLKSWREGDNVLYEKE